MCLLNYYNNVVFLHSSGLVVVCSTQLAARCCLFYSRLVVGKQEHNANVYNVHCAHMPMRR
jgi:hypothetical protein